MKKLDINKITEYGIKIVMDEEKTVDAVEDVNVQDLRKYEEKCI